MSVPAYPRLIDPKDAFETLVSWFSQTVIDKYRCPGVLVGLSGTDSLVAFLAAYRAYERAGRGDHVMGIHFAPSEDFLYDYPEAEAHLWFSREILPWLAAEAPKAAIRVDTSIDWRFDGLRWGMLADIASVDWQDERRRMRPSDQKFWVCGTRNRSEELLYNYSNASLLASLQPLVKLWKSEILTLASHLGVPQLAVSKSCETDCLCGRDWLRANHPKELDLVLMSSVGLLDQQYVVSHVSPDLFTQLAAYVDLRIAKGSFKRRIPYPADIEFTSHPLVQQFEDGTLDLRTFNHRQHLYIAWYYLSRLSFSESLERYAHFLRAVLDRAHVGHKFSRSITEAYFHKLHAVMQDQPLASFDEAVVHLEDAERRMQVSAQVVVV